MIDIGTACIVCWREGIDRAHLIDRSLAADPDEDPLRTVRLCRVHHDAYDAHELDLLPYLEPRHRAELAKAVEVHGLISTLERVTGQHWAPTTAGAVRWEVANTGPEVVVNGKPVGHGMQGMVNALGAMLDA
jgi:hypothetical protein